MDRHNLLGKIFGDITVIDSAPNAENKHKDVQWLCKCSCGKILIVKSARLLNKNHPKKSCGCKNFRVFHKNRKYLDPKKVSYLSLVKRYRSAARNKTKNISWLLTDDKAIDLFKSNCYYCGAIPYNTYNVYRTKAGKYITKNIEWADMAEIYFNGIDRLDSNDHYSINNVVSCCTICNFAKNELSLDDFYKWIEKIANYNGFKK